MLKYYTGAGSRKTPAEVLGLMRRMAKTLGSKGIVLRSGGAEGADSAFEQGCDQAKGPKRIYLPWHGFSERDVMESDDVLVPEPCADHDWWRYRRAQEIAASIHPAWDRCSGGARMLHTRNVYQVLGYDLESPSLLLVCWTPGGRPTGGTRTAIVLAKRHGVPVFNLADRPWSLREILVTTIEKRRSSAPRSS